MGVFFVISGLVAKRAELTGQIEHYQAQIRQLSASVDHLDATSGYSTPIMTFPPSNPKAFGLPTHGLHKGRWGGWPSIP